MLSLDDNIYLYRKMYKRGKVDPFVFYILFTSNKHWVVDVCINEFDKIEIKEAIEAEYLYCIGLNALERSILEFDYNLNDIEDYYYDYIKKYLNEEIEENYLDELGLLYTVKDYDFMWNMEEKFKYIFENMGKKLYEEYRNIIEEAPDDNYYVNILKEKMYD